MSSPVPNVNLAQRDAFWLRVALALIWIATGLGVLSPEFQRIGEDYLLRLQLPSWVMWVTCAFEVLLGLRVLLAPIGTLLAVLQALLIITFTALVAWVNPSLLWDPMGVLTKNAPLLAMIATCWLLERGGWTSAALWTLRAGMASVWLLEGLLPAQIEGNPTLPNIVRFLSRGMITEPRPSLRIIGLLQAASAVAVLLLRGPLLGLLVLGQSLALVMFCVVITCYEPLAWVHPFGPVTKNISIFIGTLVVLRRLRETGQC